MDQGTPTPTPRRTHTQTAPKLGTPKPPRPPNAPFAHPLVLVRLCACARALVRLCSCVQIEYGFMLFSIGAIELACVLFSYAWADGWPSSLNWNELHGIVSHVWEDFA